MVIKESGERLVEEFVCRGGGRVKFKVLMEGREGRGEG